jgi:hypothetical protein
MKMAEVSGNELAFLLRRINRLMHGASKDQDFQRRFGCVSARSRTDRLERKTLQTTQRPCHFSKGFIAIQKPGWCASWSSRLKSASILIFGQFRSRKVSSTVRQESLGKEDEMI